MQVVILAAGRGTRMGSLTKHTPKPLISVLQKPLIVHVLDALPNEITECIIVIGYLGEQIVSYLGGLYKNMSIAYVQQEHIGTGGGLLSAQSVLGEKFMVVNADDIYHRDELVSLIGVHTTYGISYGVRKSNRLKKAETVVFNEQGLLCGRKKIEPFVPHWFGTGAYFLDERVWLEKFYMLRNGEYSIPHTLSVCSLPVHIRKFTNWLPVNTPEELLLAEHRLSAKGVKYNNYGT